MEGTAAAAFALDDGQYYPRPRLPSSLDVEAGSTTAATRDDIVMAVDILLDPRLTRVGYRHCHRYCHGRRM